MGTRCWGAHANNLRIGRNPSFPHSLIQQTTLGKSWAFFGGRLPILLGLHPSWRHYLLVHHKMSHHHLFMTAAQG